MDPDETRAAQAREVGELLRRYRVERGLTQEELSAAVTTGVSAKTIGNVENGRHRPQRHVVVGLARALGITAAEERALLSAWRQAGPAATPSRARGWLPGRPTALIGREQDIKAVRDAYRTPEPRLLTLTGAPGVGKTRLALQVAAELSSQFSDGCMFIPLDAISDHTLAPSAIAEALHARESAAADAWQAVRAALQGKQMLLILDTMEHLLALAPAVAALLHSCSGVRILATSRAALRVRGEQVYEVAPLAVPAFPYRDTVEALERIPAVALFLARARTVAPGFQITTHNAAAVAEICRRLDGLPLALELAAPWIRVWPPHMLLARLDQRLQVLIDGARDLPPRQQTVRAALAWSHDLLDADEQVLFRRLGVFAGGWAFEAAEAVFPVERQVALWIDLARLADKGLLIVRHDSGDEARFQMLDTIREFALERLEETGEAEDMRRQHALYFMRLAEQLDAALSTPGWEAWLRRLDRDRDNLHAALAWAREADPELSLRLSAALWRCWYAHDELRKGRQWLADAIARVPETDTAARAQVLLGLGAMEWVLGGLSAAASALDEAARITVALGNQHMDASISNIRGLIAAAKGETSLAITLYGQALAMAREHANTRIAAAALHNLSLAAADHGDYAQARIYAGESRAARGAFGTAAARQGSEPHDTGSEDWRSLREDRDAALGLVTLPRPR